MNNIEVFERYAHEYDRWFEVNRSVYESEVKALRMLCPKKGKGLEVGVGTGRFALPLGIKIGVEPARAMADMARKRGIEVYEAKAESLPFDNSSFDFVLFVVTICFVQDPIKALKEIKRVLKKGGKIIIGIIDKNSFLGKLYEKRREKSKFYKKANFYSVNQVLKWLEEIGFDNIHIYQTIFRNPEEIRDIEPVKKGYGEGGFVVISAEKK